MFFRLGRACFILSYAHTHSRFGMSLVSLLLSSIVFSCMIPTGPIVDVALPLIFESGERRGEEGGLIHRSKLASFNQKRSPKRVTDERTVRV